MKIYEDNLHRMAYATDASAYREKPAAVAYPETEDDIRTLIGMARERHTCLIPRAGGTSIAGQVVGSGIVADISRHWNRILEINGEERWALVQPGVVRDELNIALKPYGLFFSPETSTSNRCCIGGMFGNNSCGTHSLVYGSTRDHILEADGILADGSPEHFREYTVEELEARFGSRFWTRESASLAESIYAQLIRFATDPDTRRTIADNYPDPSLRRRSCGYAIDEAISGIAPDCGPGSRINLCRLLAGSEGTLAFITSIKVSLDAIPPKGKMAVCAHCDSLEKSFEANLVALRHSPEAIELMDGRILELSKDNPAQLRNRFFVKGDPAALIIVELCGEDLDSRADALEKDLASSGLSYCCTRVYGDDVSKVWALRKAGLGVLSGMKGDAKPVGVIEDTAVAAKRLPAYMADFRAMMGELGLECVYYGHISTGELHLRPIINLKTVEGKAMFRAVAERTARLVRKHKGSLSGEHGDGRLRGEFIPLMYGDGCYRMMCEVKACWDPDGIMNVGKIVGAPGMDEWLRFEAGQKYMIEDCRTYFNWRAAFDECKVDGASGVRSQAHALMCSVEQCNGAGDCRKSNLIGGTLCPAYKVSRDEIWTTRARANVIREVLTHGVGDKTVYQSAELKEVLDSCLACKGCRGECPSNVDMTRIRAELLQHIHDEQGTPLRSFAVARMAAVESLGRIVRPLYNFFASWKPSADLIRKCIGFAAERKIPALSRHTMRQLVRRELRASGARPTKGRVYLFADEFTNAQEAETGLRFARLLMKLGYEVSIPKHVESGRAAISKGCLKLARKFALKNVRLLKEIISDETPLVGIEPSCILSFRDEYPDLVPPDMRDCAKRLGESCLLFDEFIMREVAAGRICPSDFKPDTMDVWLHGHCHQKALVGISKTAEMLHLLSGARVHVIPSGCCGMAGSFGYEKEHYRTSLQIGEMVLFPAVRKAMGSCHSDAPAFVVAPGTSCRQQILDGTGVHAVHPIDLLYNYMA